MKVKFTYKSFCELISKTSTLVDLLYTDVVSLLAVEYLINGFQNIDNTLFKIYNKKNKKIFDITLPLPYKKSNFKLRFLNNRFLSLTYNDHIFNSYKNANIKTVVLGKNGYSTTYNTSINKSLKTKVLNCYNFYIGYDTIHNSINYIEFYDSEFNYIRTGEFLIDFVVSTEDELMNEIVIISTDENKTVIKLKNNKELVDITFHKKYTKICCICYTDYFVKGYDKTNRIEFCQQYNDSYIMYYAPPNHYNKL